MSLTLRHRYLAVDQYGDHIPITQYPRKELLEHFGVKHAEKMYVETRDGKSHHTGYVIAGHWLTILRVSAWEGGQSNAENR